MAQAFVIASPSILGQSQRKDFKAITKNRPLAIFVPGTIG
jgi:hypothetical protein